MLVRQRLIHLLTLLLVLGLALAACERPIPGSEDTAAPDANVGGGEPADSVTTPEPAESGEGDTPRLAEEATATPEPAADTETTEDESGSDTAKDESTDETTTESGEAAKDETTKDESDAETPGATPTTHTVAAGENLYRIGLKYHVSWVRLAEYNNLPNAHRIKVGQVINIPGADGPQSDPTSTPSPLTETTYIVKAGDNLFRIGLKYNIDWTQIAEANGIVNPNRLEIGKELKIPVDTPGPTPQFTHQVESSETLFLISLRYGVPWQAIAEKNEVGSPYVIYVGQTLVIPGD